MRWSGLGAPQRKSNPLSSEVGKGQRIEELMRLFDSNHVLIRERQQRKLSQEYILA
jgi:hypothetical protein